MIATLTESRRARLVLFPVLYVAQGLPWGFVSVGYGVLLTDLGYDAAAIGAALGLAYLPWSFKVLWGPLLDAVPPLRIGRRRPFLVAAQILMGFTLIGLAAIDVKTSLAAATALLFLNNTFAALQDVATDALAVDVLRDDERGRVNALMWAGKLLGVAIGGGGGLLLAKAAGWGALFLAQAAFAWAAAALVALVRESPPSATDVPADGRLVRLLAFLGPFAVVGAILAALAQIEAEWVSIVQPFVAVGGALLAWPLVDRSGFAAMRQAFSTRAPWLGVLVALVTPIGYASTQAAQTRLIRGELHLPEEQIATLSGVVDPLAGVVGALVGGVLADRFGARPTMGVMMGGIALGLTVFGLGGEWWPSFAFLAVWTALTFGTLAAYNAASLGMYMGLSDRRVGATQFAVFMAATNLTYAWTAPLGGAVADRFGVPTLFVGAGLVQLLSIGVLLRR